jgi:RNA polymerase sigma factor (sigma-70 family)
MLSIENHLDLIRKIVWGYVKSNPGLEFDDMFSEVCLACIEARHLYDPEKGCESTFIWYIAKNTMNNICQHLKYRKEVACTSEFENSTVIENRMSPEEQLIAKEEWQAILNALSTASKEICSLVLDGPSPYLPTDKPKTCRSIIIKELRERGWSWPSIWSSFREIKEILST